MAASPQYKVYSATGEYVAACKFAEDAASVAGLHGDGSKVKFGHSKIVWVEGSEEIAAGESCDHARDIIHARVEEIQRKAYLKVYGRLPSQPAGDA